MFDLRLFVLVISISACIWGRVYAQQLGFAKNESAQQIQFSYQWQDHAARTRELAFSLPKSRVKQLSRGVKTHKPDIAQRHVYVELMKQAQQIDPKQAKVKIDRVGRDIRVAVSSASPEVQAKWQQTMASKQTQAFEQYLQQNYFTLLRTHLGQEGVKPDHIRYIQDNLTLLLPVAQALYEKLPQGSNVSGYVNLLLSWIQTIPYNVLEDRLLSNGAGYFSPVEVLLANRGDCDSKTALMASLMRTLLPKLSMVIIYLPRHALLGANLPSRGSEQLLEIEGMKYLLLEPTGPALLQMGQVADASATALTAGMYSYEKVP